MTMSGSIPHMNVLSKILASCIYDKPFILLLIFYYFFYYYHFIEFTGSSFWQRQSRPFDGKFYKTP